MTKEEKATAIYDAVNDMLLVMECKSWQNVIVDTIKEISSTREKEIPSDCIYWLTELYDMFVKLEQSGIEGDL